MENVKTKKSPEWEIDFEVYLDRLKLDRRSFRDELRLPVVNRVRKVLPLRDLARISSLIPLSVPLLLKLLRDVPTNDGQYPFSQAEFCVMHINPAEIKIGQKFVYRENYNKLLEELGHLFVQKYAMSAGVTNLGAFAIFGQDSVGTEAMAFYIPPIIEEHGNNKVIMDGVHRNFIGYNWGATLNAVVVRNIGVPFPCGLRSWKEARVISLSEKPKDINERYFDLNTGLFRDLKHLGIDG